MKISIIKIGLLAACSALTVVATGGAAKAQSPIKSQATTTEQSSAAIGWIPTWDQAIAEARQTRKPILLIAAAPSCGGVPGVW
ncbi:MAG: hypothetical protein JSS83_16970 [Cyanobacteria bacterium SZAS LIN-3]|nr:hypothetical protein [Cyanobacteria bacterium SZAS LIN-3]MBS2010737.1 hypothetical protein [Cyanobacteria bacterium SZAS TMP-1]